MNITAKIKNNIDLAKYNKNARRAMADMLFKNANDIVNYAKQNASGRPGPNVRTGNLRRSIRIDEPPDMNNLRAVVSAGGKFAYYAVFVEFGTRRSKPYPFFEPAVAKKRAELMSDKNNRLILGEILRK
jgi:HK97 gp10 family phage protein